jgi:hypothetical protein
MSDFGIRPSVGNEANSVMRQSASSMSLTASMNVGYLNGKSSDYIETAKKA